jgi:hypothetical protein
MNKVLHNKNDIPDGVANRRLLREKSMVQLI